MSTTCCPIGSEPALSADYKPQGRQVDLDGLRCYTNGSGEKSIIVYYDIFGYDSGRTKLICDQIANAGYCVVLPDIYHGDAWPADKPMDTLMEWLKNFPWESTIKNDTNKVLEYLKGQGADKSIGCLGFCAGAFSVFHLCQMDEVKCGASCHPSVHLCGLFGETPDGLSGQLKSPQLVYPAGGDPAMYKPGGEVYEVLQKKFGDKFEYKEYPEMNHGWVTRGDVSKSEVARDVKLAMEGVMKFFEKYL